MAFRGQLLLKAAHDLSILFVFLCILYICDDACGKVELKRRKLLIKITEYWCANTNFLYGVYPSRRILIRPERK